MKIILASASPRRSELLKAAGIDFEIKPSHVEEIADLTLPPHKIVQDIAMQKAHPIALLHPERVIVSCDTMVWMEGHMLGKPADHDDAVRMLSLLSGKTHAVYSGVCIRRGEMVRTFYDKTLVTFIPISLLDMEDYIATGEPFDKAGGYAMQERAARFVRTIRGNPTNVVGLPMWKLMKELEYFMK